MAARRPGSARLARKRIVCFAAACLSVALLGTVRGDGNDAGPVAASVAVLPAYVPASIAPAQPIPFSHRRHAGELGLACAVCHVGASPAARNDVADSGGGHMTLPGTETCMNCHVAIGTDKPPIRDLTAMHTANQDVEWVRVYRLLEGVNWSHRPHIGAGVDCQTCHGQVATLEVMRVATPVTAMATCLNCHRSTGANAQCETCHTWPAADDFRRFAD